MSQQNADNLLAALQNSVQMAQQEIERRGLLEQQNADLTRQIVTAREGLRDATERHVRELAERDATIAMFVQENTETLDRLAAFTRERDSAQEERDAALAAAAVLRQEGEAIVAERDAQREQRDTLQRELDASRDEHAAFRREREEFTRQRTEFEARVASTRVFLQQTWGGTADALPLQIAPPQPTGQPRQLLAICGPSAASPSSPQVSPAPAGSPPSDRRRQTGDMIKPEEVEPSPQSTPPAQSASPGPYLLPDWMAAVPAHYRNQIPLPLSTTQIDYRASSLRFTRKWLGSAEQIAGNHEGVNVRVAAQKARFGITNYYVVNLEGNPWMPRQAGESGWMFVGLNERDQELGKGEVRELFIKFTTNQHGYLGTYQCTREDDLSAEEFSGVNWAVKHSTGRAAEREKKSNRKRFCKWTAMKKEGISTDADALRQYEAGTIRVPCIRLACVGFNRLLFDFLHRRYQEDPSNQAASSSGGDPDSQSDDDESTDSNSDADYKDTAQARRTRLPPVNLAKRKRHSERRSAVGVSYCEAKSEDDGPPPSSRRRKLNPIDSD